MTHSEKTRRPPTEAPAPIGQLADFATLLSRVVNNNATTVMIKTTDGVDAMCPR